MNLLLHTTFPVQLAEEWNDLLAESSSHVPFLRYEYLRTWWQTRGGGEWPQASLALVTAHENGCLSAVAPLFFTPSHQGRSALMLLGSIEISDYLDFIARAETLPIFLQELLPWLAKNPAIPAWQALDLYNLLDSSPSLPALAEAARQAGWIFQLERLQHSPYIPLPGDWEGYLAGIDKKQRHEIRRKMRRAEDSGLPMRWYIVQDANTLQNEIEAFFTIMVQDPDKARFLTPAMRAQMQEVMECAFQNGCLHLAFLEINGQKAATVLSFDYLNRLWVYNSGFDRSLLEYSPGWVLLGYLLKWANEQKRQEFDFMRGDEEYKYRFGAVDRYVMRATLLKA